MNALFLTYFDFFFYLRINSFQVEGIDTKDATREKAVLEVPCVRHVFPSIFSTVQLLVIINVNINISLLKMQIRVLTRSKFRYLATME